jgi:hypothetical protein
MDDDAGRVERAVRADIEALGSLEGEFHRSMAEMAYVLARAVDDSGADGPAAAVNWARELRMTLDRLREVARERGGSGEDGEFGTPDWDAAQSGAADVGAAGGGGGASAGQAVDAASASDCGRGVGD